MSDRRISTLRPGQDQTLLSFLRQAQEDAGYSEEGFANLLAGAPLTDSRLAERRSFDWDSLSRFFNASADELFGLSERSLYYGMEDASRGAVLHQRAPWTRAAGYGAHCPCCLKKSPYWRRSWLNPGALVCEKHGTVLVRHCCGCGGDLAEMTWRKPAPFCPTCATDLSFSPPIQASHVLAERATIVRGEAFDLLQAKPVNWADVRLARLAMMWRAARLLVAEPRFIKMCNTFCTVGELGIFDLGSSAQSRALTYAQCFVVAHYLTEFRPELFQHYWLATSTVADFKDADQAVLLKLTEVEDTFSLEEKRTQVHGQLTISFASWEELNGIPSAA